jgi:teichuronic acid exporter
MSLAQRSAYSIAWQGASTWIARILQFGRTILLARLLPINVFGFYALAISIINLTSVIADFGTGQAFIHRSEETEDEQGAARGYFTIKLILLPAWIFLLAGMAYGLFQGEERTAFLVLSAARIPSSLAFPSIMILTRRVKHRRLGILQITDSILSSLIAILIATNSGGLWALISVDVAHSILVFVFVFTWSPVWSPRLEWNPEVIRYYFRYGSRVFLSQTLLRTLDRLDDLWTNFFLGERALGLYSRAYTFATYPRTLLAIPINSVTLSTFSELKGDRNRLSIAFNTTSRILIRSGFLFVGTFALIVPEFVELLLGVKWLPMVPSFMLLIIYALFDPMGISMSYLLVALGLPERIVRIRLWQLVALSLGLFILGGRYGIVGVAIAADLMMVFGIVLYLKEVGKHIDLSVIKLYFIPAIAIVVAMILSYGLMVFLLAGVSLWLGAVLKIVAFGTLYSSVILVFEWNETRDLIRQIRSLLFRKQAL